MNTGFAGSPLLKWRLDFELFRVITSELYHPLLNTLPSKKHRCCSDIQAGHSAALFYYTKHFPICHLKSSESFPNVNFSNPSQLIPDCLMHPNPFSINIMSFYRRIRAHCAAINRIQIIPFSIRHKPAGLHRSIRWLRIIPFPII